MAAIITDVTTAELANIVSTNALIEGCQYNNTQTGKRYLATSANTYRLINPYKSYTAILRQEGTQNPTVLSLLENSFNSDVVWTRNAVGIYWGTLAGEFTNSLTFILTPYGDGDNGTLIKCSTLGYINIWRGNDGIIEIRTYSDEGITPADIDLGGHGWNILVDLRVYEFTL